MRSPFARRAHAHLRQPAAPLAPRRAPPREHQGSERSSTVGRPGRACPIPREKRPFSGTGSPAPGNAQFFWYPRIRSSGLKSMQPLNHQNSPAATVQRRDFSGSWPSPGRRPVQRCAAGTTPRQAATTLRSPPFGNLSLLHMTDSHAQLLPVFFANRPECRRGRATGRPRTSWVEPY